VNDLTNQRLRDYVTRVGFDLTLARSQIAALVLLDVSIKTKRHPGRVYGPLARSYNFFASGVHALEDKGLVIHHYNEAVSNKALKIGYRGDTGLGPHFTITKAGRLVIGLLKESGLYDEYAEPLLPGLKAVSA
jgi:hypothetical protein